MLRVVRSQDTDIPCLPLAGRTGQTNHRQGRGEPHWKLDRTYSCHPSLVPACWEHPLRIALQVADDASAGVGVDRKLVGERQVGEGCKEAGEDGRREGEGGEGEREGFVQSLLPTVSGVPSSAVAAAEGGGSLNDPLASRGAGWAGVGHFRRETGRGRRKGGLGRARGPRDVREKEV